MSVFFTRGATEVKLSNPTWPYGDERRPNQTVGYSLGGAIKVARNGEDDVRVRLNFRRLSQAEYDLIDSFLRSTVTFSSYTFQYQDWNGVTFNNMRYESGWETFKASRGSLYDGTLVLREDLGV